MSGDSSSPKGYRFGVFEVDLPAAAVRRDGVQIRVRGKPFDILVVLLERAGELVSRDDLRQRLWASDTFVDFDHGLNAAMNRLRDALGDSAESPRYIQTIPRRGYRFIAPVETLRPAVVAEPAVAAAPAEAVALPSGSRVDLPRRSLVAALVLGLLVVAGWVLWRPAADARRPGTRWMLAVLPFENLSGEADQDYFSQGITEELIAQLGALNPEALGVIARTTAARYSGSTLSVREIGRTLGVQYVLEGSVRRSGPRVRITAQLIDANRQTQLWSETYDHEVSDVLLTQRDVAMRVADALAMSVLGSRPVPHMPSPAAYESYLRGRYLRLQATQDSLTRAQQYFEDAIARDDTYAAAHAGLADVFHLLGAPGWEFGPARELLPLALTSAARAIELDPQLPDGYAVRGMTRLWLEWDPASAEQDLRKAIGLNASYAQAHQYLSTVFTVQGHMPEAIAEARRSAELDPLSPVAGTTLAYRLYYAGDYAGALTEFSRVTELAPDFASAHLGRAQSLRELGRPDEELAALRRAVEVAGGRTYLQAHLAFAEGRRGRADAARKIASGLHELAATRYVAPYDLALAAAGHNDRAAVRAHLERAFADRSGWMLFVPLEREFVAYREELADLVARVRPATR